MSLDAIPAILVSAISLGSLYALLASGLSLIWSTLKVFNFAHGATLTLGAYLTWTFVNEGWPLAMAIVAALIGIAIFAVLFEWLCVRPFIRRKNGDMLVMIATLAAATIITSGAQVAWGPEIKRLPSVTNANIVIGDTTLGGNQLAAVIATPLLLGAVWWLLHRTDIGLRIRAVEQNRDFARLVGIRPELVYSVTIIVAALLAACAGVLLGGIQFVTPAMGDDPLLKAFVVVVFGGLARLSGSIVGAYVVGGLEAFSQYYFGLFATPVVIFLLMIVVMLVRPEGMIGPRKAHR